MSGEEPIAAKVETGADVKISHPIVPPSNNPLPSEQIQTPHLDALHNAVLPAELSPGGDKQDAAEIEKAEQKPKTPQEIIEQLPPDIRQPLERLFQAIDLLSRPADDSEISAVQLGDKYTIADKAREIKNRIDSAAGTIRDARTIHGLRAGETVSGKILEMARARRECDVVIARVQQEMEQDSQRFNQELTAIKAPFQDSWDMMYGLGNKIVTLENQLYSEEHKSFLAKSFRRSEVARLRQTLQEMKDADRKQNELQQANGKKTKERNGIISEFSTVPKAEEIKRQIVESSDLVAKEVEHALYTADRDRLAQNGEFVQGVIAAIVDRNVTQLRELGVTPEVLAQMSKLVYEGSIGKISNRDVDYQLRQKLNLSIPQAKDALEALERKLFRIEEITGELKQANQQEISNTIRDAILARNPNTWKDAVDKGLPQSDRGKILEIDDMLKGFGLKRPGKEGGVDYEFRQRLDRFHLKQKLTSRNFAEVWIEMRKRPEITTMFPPAVLQTLDKVIPIDVLERVVSADIPSPDDIFQLVNYYETPWPGWQDSFPIPDGFGVESGKRWTNLSPEQKLQFVHDTLRRVINDSQDEQKRDDADQRNRALMGNSEQSSMPLVRGTLLHGTSVESLGAIFKSGDRAGEFFGFDQPQDATPFCADFSEVITSGAQVSEIQKRMLEQNDRTVLAQLEKTTDFARIYYESISASYGAKPNIERGQAWDRKTDAGVTLIIDRTRSDAFLKGTEHEGDMGGRAAKHTLLLVGIPSTEISGLIVNSQTPEVLEKAKAEIVKNGFFIPIYNVDGSILFTPDQYDTMRLGTQQVSENKIA